MKSGRLSPNPNVSIHTLHELEARNGNVYEEMSLGSVSIHTLHELEARINRGSHVIISRVCFHSYASRIGSKTSSILCSTQMMRFPFIRFTNWKQVSFEEFQVTAIVCFHSYASRIGSKNICPISLALSSQWFPFIRFTNWKQVQNRVCEYILHNFCFHSYASRIGSKLIYISPESQSRLHRFHSYASRIGSKPAHGHVRNIRLRVSIHTLHELEARLLIPQRSPRTGSFPFIRFTNWKQG